MCQRIVPLVVLAAFAMAAPANAEPRLAALPEAATEARIQRFDARREANEARKDAEAARLRSKPDANAPVAPAAARKPKPKGKSN